VLISPDGKIAKAYDTVTPAEHPDQVLADLRAL
jgi:peroxiredoxin